MNICPHNKPIIDSIYSVANGVIDHASDLLPTRSDLGKINFEEGKENIQNSTRLFEKLAAHPLDPVPKTILDKLLNELNGLAGTLINIY